MAEQLCDLNFKPWLKGNFSELQVNGADVSTGSGNSAYSTSAVFASEGNLFTTGSYQLNLNSLTGNAFSANINSFTCLESGVYAVDANIILGATTTDSEVPNQPPMFEVSLHLINAMTGKRVKCGNQSPYGFAGLNLLNNTIMNGTMSFNAGDLCFFQLTFNYSVNTPRFNIFGQLDANYVSTARFVKIN